MVTRQRLRVGATYAGKIVTVHVEDTHFRVTCDGAEISLHPRAEQRPVTRTPDIGRSFMQGSGAI